MDDNESARFVRRYFGYPYIPELAPMFGPHRHNMGNSGNSNDDVITPVRDNRPIVLLLLPDRTVPFVVSRALYEHRLAVVQRILGEWAIVRRAERQVEIVAELYRDPCMVVLFTHTLEGISSSASGPDLREYAMRGGKVVVSRGLHGYQAD
ncbi:uncharacterized protein PpBr36_10008 [Pyricularia pennisetigena]|uniref:uncharacterized protein n=1 Tax=Pyricularia pennisetigena TaxID=1578925 RepID=UPI00114FE32E|nr:uncharacterized protein PpBr36_10008 [Pyricularia pennisetigena]TLS22418.1 hypothetical protein PpBr36_10008 [Pyricularia pennisetigena]